ncbi:MAG: hypothetical protein ABJF01_07545 [bacterium]
MDEFTPPTQPFGALVPPPKVPGTAIATASPAPLPHRPAPLSRTLSDQNVFRRLVQQTLDAVDDLADTLAEGLGLRRL